MSMSIPRWTFTLLCLAAIGCGSVEPRSSSAVLSLGSRTVAVSGTMRDVTVEDGVIRMKGAGTKIVIDDARVRVGSDVRSLPPGAVVRVDVSPDRVLVEVGDQSLVFSR